MKLLWVTCLSAAVATLATARCPAYIPPVATYLTVIAFGEETSALWTVSPTQRTETETTGCGAEAYITQSQSEGTCESVTSTMVSEPVRDGDKCNYHFSDESSSYTMTLVLSCDYSAMTMDLDSTVEVTRDAFGSFSSTFTGRYQGVCSDDSASTRCPTDIEHVTKIITEKSSLPAYNSPYTWVISPSSKIRVAPNGYETCSTSGYISQFRRCESMATVQYEEPKSEGNSCVYKYEDKEKKTTMTLTVTCDPSSPDGLNFGSSVVRGTNQDGKLHYALAGWYAGVCDDTPATTTNSPYYPPNPNDNGDDPDMGVLPIWLWCAIGGAVFGAIVFTAIVAYVCAKRRQQRMMAILGDHLIEGGPCAGIVVFPPQYVHRSADSAQRLVDRHPAENEESLLINGYQSTDDRLPAQEQEQADSSGDSSAESSPRYPVEEVDLNQVN